MLSEDVSCIHIWIISFRSEHSAILNNPNYFHLLYVV